MDVIQLIPIIYDKFILFTLIFTRIAAMLTTFVVFRREMITSRIIIALSAVLSVYILLAYNGAQVSYDVFSIAMTKQILLQTFLGFMGGFILNMVIEIFLAVGQVISSQIGLSVASLIDFRFGTITSLTHFYIIIGTLLFLHLNGHLYAIKTVLNSFTAFPLFYAIVPHDFLTSVLNYAAVIFSGSVSLSLSIILVIMLTNIALAVMSKFAPQFNLFTIGINLEMVIGLFCIYYTFTIFTDNGALYIEQGIEFLTKTMVNARN